MHDPSSGPLRSLLLLFAAVGMAGTGYIGAMTVGPLVAVSLAGSERWAGVPVASVVVGTVIGSRLWSGVMVRRGRRGGLRGGYGLAAVGAGLAGFGVYRESIGGYLVGAVIFGVGWGAHNLARYAAADLFPTRRASAIGWVVWAGTIGAVAGPLLLEPARALAVGAALPGLVGPYAVAAVTCLCAHLTVTGLPRTGPTGRPDHSADGLNVEPGRSGLRAAWRPLLCLVVNQYVMVLVMSMTPVHLTQTDPDLRAVGFVIGAHVLGMFAFSPLTGWLGDRFGRPALLRAAVVLMSSACLLAATAEALPQLTIALFVLGLGWNASFVAGSALVAEAGSGGAQVRNQGAADSFVWTASAVASLSAGLILAWGGYSILALWGAVAALLPAAFLGQGLGRPATPAA